MQIIIKLKVTVISDEVCWDCCRCENRSRNSNFRPGIEWKLILLENDGDDGLKGAFCEMFICRSMCWTYSAEAVSEMFAFGRARHAAGGWTVCRSKFVNFPKQTVRVYNFIIASSSGNNMWGEFNHSQAINKGPDVTSDHRETTSEARSFCAHIVGRNNNVLEKLI